MSSMSPNVYLLAADKPRDLLVYLREQPSLAISQDEHGYSLIHAAASYNHLDLLRALVREFNAPVDLRDEDGETALFVVETVDAARVLVEELGLDITLKNDEGQTAREKIREEDEYPAVAEYLSQRAATNGLSSSVDGEANGLPADLPPVPDGLAVTMGTMNEEDAGSQEVDPEFRRRIEQLAAREDFQTPEGQAELRRLVQEMLSSEDLADGRNVRPRQD